MEVERAVALRLPVVEDPAVVEERAAAGDPHLGVGHRVSLLHRDARDYELEDRARRVRGGDRAIEQGPARVGVQRPPLHRLEAAHERVRVEAGRAVHGEHRAAARLEGDYRAGHGVGEQLGHPLLQLEVDVQAEILAGDRLHGLAALELAHDPAQRVDLDVAHARRTGEQPVVDAFYPRLPDDAARLVALELLEFEIRIADLGHVADDVSEQRPAGVAPLGRRFDHDPAGQVCAPFFDGGDLGEAGVALDGDRVIGMPAVAVDQSVGLLAGEFEYGRQSVEHHAERIDRERQDGDRVTGHVLGDDLTVAIVDRAPRRRDGERANPVTVRLQRVGRMLEDLDPEELHGQSEDDQQHQYPGQAPADALM